MQIIPRGVKLNNPLNIRLSANQWQGKITPSSDLEFEQFDSALHGIRAGAVILITYYHRGLDTIRKIINEWAPPSENPTLEYCKDVADFTGFDIDAHVDIDIVSVLSPFIAAMIKQESGYNSYDWSLIETACDSALETHS